MNQYEKIRLKKDKELIGSYFFSKEGDNKAITISEKTGIPRHRVDKVLDYIMKDMRESLDKSDPNQVVFESKINFLNKYDGVPLL